MKINLDSLQFKKFYSEIKPSLLATSNNLIKAEEAVEL